MSVSIESFERMIMVCDINHVQLAIGYRLHLEPHHI